MDGPDNDDDAITPFRDEEDADFLRSDLVTTPDNTTLSEELSRFSSSPSRSQSSSCTSITNPFYDGPGNPVPPVVPMIPAPPASSAALTITSHSQQPSVYQHSGTTASAGGRRSSRGTRRPSSNPQPSFLEEAEEFHENPTLARQESRLQQRVILIWNFGYLATCGGFLQLLQLVMTIATLSCLTSAGADEGGLLNLPLSWHFRIMIFVLVLTLLVTMASLFGHFTSLITVLGLEWIFFDMIVYSLFAFLYLVGSSLVASAFDFYQKMSTDVSKKTIDQLVTSVILGYVCMLLHGITAFLSYRRWKIQYRLYQRRKLIEEDEIDL
ncbi:hypothetical protein PoB_002139000 [Plakobranchus ocellatus]|uniref:MARVEL domain-containing protein n=1 Tax=Plakobranchus ocellatus TaxID=259542 RepID=A0AAV3ZJZ2_9GAST|nr:hypothetical protein PoB_002139000 [Plakobranchus ocellatus]